MSSKTIRACLFGMAALALAAGMACSGGARVSASAKAAATAGTTTSTASGLDLKNGIVLTRVRMLVRTIRVEDATCAGSHDTDTDTTSAASTCMSADGCGSEVENESDDDCGIASGPALADVGPADLAQGTIHWVSGMIVPPGTYEEVAFHLNTLPAELAGTDAGLLEMAKLHASVAVDGTIDGAAFLFKAPFSVTQHVQGPFTVDESHPANFTLSVDPSGWFGGTGAARLDPNAPTDQGAIFRTIRASIRLVHDDDRDGCDDDHADAGCPGGGGSHH